MLISICGCVSVYVCICIFTYTKWGHKKRQNLFIKNCVFVLTCLNFRYLQSNLHLTQYTYGDFFLPLKTVFELVDYDALVLLNFLFHLFRHQQTVPLQRLLPPGKQKKVSQGKIWQMGRVGHRGYAVFGQTEHSEWYRQVCL